MKVNKIKNIILAITALVGLGASLITPATYAEDNICNNEHISSDIKAASGCTDDSKDRIATVITNILNVVIGISGLIAVIFIIIGGVSYMTSAGDPNKIQTAKNTIKYAVIGLIVCALAFAIVNFAIAGINNSVSPKSENA